MKRRALALLLAVGGASLPGAVVRGDDVVTIRGAYYREASTRVIQPVVVINKDLPDGYSVATHYLLDAITSASVAAGAAKDQIFTEIRNEVGLEVRKSWNNRTRVGLFYEYSAESDYWAHTFGGDAAHSFWGDTSTVALSWAVSLDQATARGRTPFCAVGDSVDCPLNTYFAGLSWTQVLSPYSLAQLNFESAYLDGFQGNLYRTVPNSPLTFENPPEKRLRNAIAARVAYYFRSMETGVQLHFRYYHDFYPGTSPTGYDPWQINSYTFEARVYHQLTSDLQLRLTFRLYLQPDSAAFWCDTLANPNCYPANFSILGTPESSDPKLGPMNTEYPEIKLYWQAESLRAVPFFRWFSTGTFEISYGYYYQSTYYGNAHVLQTGYTMPY